MKSKKIIIGTTILAVAVAAGAAAFVFTSQSTQQETKQVTQKTEEKYVNPLTGLNEKPELNRPTVVSIDNVGDAIPQSNLSYADLIYEFPVEGLQTRLQAVFYTDAPELVGPIRSVRPYFIDVVKELNAVYVAYGWSPAAKEKLQNENIPYINGMVHTDLYYRSSEKVAPHNAYIKWENVEKKAEKEGWSEENYEPAGFGFIGESKSKSIIKSFKEEMKQAAKRSEAESAQVIEIKYSYSNCEFVYDPEKNMYKRRTKGADYIDKETGKPIYTDNIIVQKVNSQVLDTKGRLKIDMNAGGDAILFTGGKEIKGSWTKEDGITLFRDNEGEEYKLTKGKTWIEVADQNCNISVKK